MEKEAVYLSEAEIIRQAERERARVVAEFFSRLFSRKERDVMPAHPVAAE